MNHVTVPAHDLYADDSTVHLEWSAADNTALRARFERDGSQLVPVRVEARTRPPQPLDIGAEVLPEALVAALQRRGFDLKDGTAAEAAEAPDNARADDTDPYGERMGQDADGVGAAVGQVAEEGGD